MTFLKVMIFTIELRRLMCSNISKMSD